MRPFVPHKLHLAKLEWESFIPFIAEAKREIARYESTELMSGVSEVLCYGTAVVMEKE